MSAQLGKEEKEHPRGGDTVTSYLRTDHVKKQFNLGRRGFWNRFSRKRTTSLAVRAVDDVSLLVKKGETLVLLGESGSGKTTLGRLIVGLEKLDSGEIVLSGRPVKYIRDRGSARGRLQMVFQDPGSSLDPYMNVEACVGEAIRMMHLPRAEARKRVRECLNLVGLDPDAVLSRRTSDLSGGQKQRVAVARAIVGEPEVIVLDEPTSSIDVSIQAQVLNLLVDLQRLRRLTYVLITHDPNVARFMADNIAVMHLGKLVEYGPTNAVLFDPKHPYTKALLASAPKLGEMLPPFAAEQADVQSQIIVPKGCRYEPRCQFAMEKCRELEPKLRPVAKEGSETLVSCFLYQE